MDGQRTCVSDGDALNLLGLGTCLHVEGERTMRLVLREEHLRAQTVTTEDFPCVLLGEVRRELDGRVVGLHLGGHRYCGGCAGERWWSRGRSTNVPTVYITGSGVLCSVYLPTSKMS